MRIHIKTYGCTLNQADSKMIESVLLESGDAISDNEMESDVVVVNTCTVKDQTSQRILDHLKLLQKHGKRIVVSGCMAGANRDLLERYVPSASVVTISNAHLMHEAAEKTLNGKRMVLDDYSKRDRIATLGNQDGTIAIVPVSDGCLSSCSFCETRFARGPLNSFSETLILKAIKQAVHAGAKEVQLTSQDMGAYGIDKGTDISKLMRKISDIDGEFKVRIGMLNPAHLNRYFEGFAEALNRDRFYKFVHLPVQSGSDGVLRHMRRGYTVGEFERQVRALRERVPEVAIETDVIVGYPTETDDDFEMSRNLIKRVVPEVTNISRFGARPHASASRIAQLGNDVINRRSMEMSRTVRAVQHSLNDRFIGRDIDFIVTETNAKSFNGRNGSYRQVVVRREDACKRLALGSKHKVHVYAASANVLYGKCEGG